MPAPATLLTLDEVKKQIRVTHDETDGEIDTILSDAEDIVVTFIGARFDAAWTPDTVPGAVRAAILRQATALWASRGDDEKGAELFDDSGLAKGVRWLLQANGYRDLTVA
jgi:hypothetical protein